MKVAELWLVLQPSEWEEVNFWPCGGEASALNKTEGVNTHHRRLWVLSQIRENVDKKWILQR